MKCNAFSYLSILDMEIHIMNTYYLNLKNILFNISSNEFNYTFDNLWDKFRIYC